MTKLRKEDIAEKIIESEIQKTGANIIEALPEYPEIEVSPEEKEREFQEILKKREAYQKATKGELSFMEETRAKNKKGFVSFAKVAAIALIVGACLFGFSMRSEATRMWWLSSVEKIVGEDRREAVNNDEDRVISATAEDDARAEILEKTGIPMPIMQYRPEGLVFDAFYYDGEIRQGELYYLYDDYVLSFYGYAMDEDVSYYKIQDGTIVSEKEINTDYGNVKLLVIQSEGDSTNTVHAEWVYKNIQYQMIGKMPIEDFEKIILNFLY